jgi:hypothetical protein
MYNHEFELLWGAIRMRFNHPDYNFQELETALTEVHGINP